MKYQKPNLRVVHHCIRSHFDDTTGKEEANFSQTIQEQVVLEELQMFLGRSR